MITPDTVEVRYDDLCSFMIALSKQIKLSRGYDASYISEETMDMILADYVEQSRTDSLVDMLWNGTEYLSFDDFISHNGRDIDFESFANGKDKTSYETRKEYIESLDDNILYEYFKDDDDFIIFIW